MKKRKISERDLAAMLFIHELKEVEEIQNLLDIPISTLYYWKREDKWDIRKTNAKLNPRAIAAMFEKTIFDLLEKRKTEEGKLMLEGGDGDTIYKLTKARNDILKESNYMGIAFDVMDRFQNELREKNPKMLTVAMQSFIADFLKRLMENL